MHIFSFVLCMFLLSVAQAAEGPHAYLKEGYNEIEQDSASAVLKFLEIAFPDLYGREVATFHGHYKVVAGDKNTKVTILPDLPSGVSTRASTIQYLQRSHELGDAILFVHDSIDKEARSTKPPQSFWCEEALYRSPEYIATGEFEREFWKNYLSVHSKLDKWKGARCFKLALDAADPEKIGKHVETIALKQPPPKQYFVIMDQRQMPGQKDAQYTAEDWDAAFGKDGYTMLIDRYAKTDRE